jgi:hypothetical protein
MGARNRKIGSRRQAIMKPIKELYRLIDELTEFIHDVAPAVRVEYEKTIYTDEDANLSVYPPLDWDEDLCWELQQKITEHTVDLHIDTGYFILVGVYMPDQQVAELQKELVQTKQKVQSLEKSLAEAETLGLLQPTYAQAALVPA